MVRPKKTKQCPELEWENMTIECSASDCSVHTDATVKAGFQSWFTDKEFTCGICVSRKLEVVVRKLDAAMCEIVTLKTRIRALEDEGEMQFTAAGQNTQPETDVTAIQPKPNGDTQQQQRTPPNGDPQQKEGTQTVAGRPTLTLDQPNPHAPHFEARRGNLQVTLPGAIRFPTSTEVTNVIFADSQGKHVKKHVLDPSNITNIETYRGITLKQFSNKVKREIPLRPLTWIKNVTLFMGGNDLAEQGTTIDTFLDTIGEAVRTMRAKCPKARIHITEPLPRDDAKVDIEELFSCLMEYAKTIDLNVIQLDISNRFDFSLDRVHLNSIGTRKVCHALKRALALPTYSSNLRQSVPQPQQTMSKEPIMGARVPPLLPTPGPTWTPQRPQPQLLTPKYAQGQTNYQPERQQIGPPSHQQPKQDFQNNLSPAQWAFPANSNHTMVADVLRNVVQALHPLMGMMM